MGSPTLDFSLARMASASIFLFPDIEIFVMTVPDWKPSIPDSDSSVLKSIIFFACRFTGLEWALDGVIRPRHTPTNNPPKTTRVKARFKAGKTPEFSMVYEKAGHANRT